MSTGELAVAPAVAAPICLSKEGVVQCLRGDSVSTILAAKIRKNVRNKRPVQNKNGFSFLKQRPVSILRLQNTAATREHICENVVVLSRNTRQEVVGIT